MSKTQRAEAEHHLDTMIKAGEQAWSGIVTAEETRFGVRASPRVPNDSTWKMTFDRKQGTIRFERSQGPRNLLYIENTQEVLFRNTLIGDRGPRPIHRHPIGWNQIPLGGRPPDLRNIAIAGSTTYLSSKSYSKYRQALLTNVRPRLVGLRKNDAGQILLFCELTPSQVIPSIKNRKVLWVDSKRNGVRVRDANWHLFPDGRWQLTNASAVSWEKVNDVYAPSQFRSLVNQSSINGIEVTLDWQLVNQPISEDTFHLESLNLPNGTQIVSHKSGQRVVESRVGDSNE